MKKEEITQDAINSYKTYFHDHENKTNHDYKAKDIILDKEALFKKINIKKVEETKKHESLEVLREKLTRKAENFYKSAFGEVKQAKQIHKINTQEMYDQLNNEKKQINEMTNELKEKQILKMRH